MTQSFLINEKLPSLNEVIGANRGNRYFGAKMKKDVQQKIEGAILASGIKPMDKPVRCYLLFVEKDKRRDVDNIISAAKFILDALVEVGVLINDSQRWVKQVISLVQTGEDYHVEVTLEEIDL